MLFSSYVIIPFNVCNVNVPIDGETDLKVLPIHRHHPNLTHHTWHDGFLASGALGGIIVCVAFGAK